MLPWCFILIYWVKDPTAYEHDDLFDILGISQLHMFLCMILFVGSGPWSTWLMRCFLLSKELWSTWVFKMFCVEWETLEHMSVYVVLREKLWRKWVFMLCWAISSGTHEIWKPLCWAGSSEAHEKINWKCWAQALEPSNLMLSIISGTSDPWPLYP